MRNFITYSDDSESDVIRPLVDSATHIKKLDYVYAHDLPNEFDPPNEILEGIFTAGDGSILYGDSNSGKTFFIIDIACAIARGIKWMNRNTEKGLVIYLAAESPASLKRRLQAYQKFHNVRVPHFAIVQNPINLFDGEGDTHAVIHLIKQLEEDCGMPAKLIVGDTLARLSVGANENAGIDMGVVIEHFDRIRAATNAHFTLIHHNGKDASKGARGWTGVRAAVDTEIEVTDTVAGRCAEITKQRDLDSKGERIGFRLDNVNMGVSKWGKPIGSCVVSPMQAPEPQKSNKRPSRIEDFIVCYLSEFGSNVDKTSTINIVHNRINNTRKEGTPETSRRNICRQMRKMISDKQVIENNGFIKLAMPKV